MTVTAPPPTRPSARPSLAQQRNHHRRNRRRLLRGVLAALLVALLGTALWLVYVSRVLDTRTVLVTGAGELTPEQVQAAAAVPLGLPLARQPLDAIARRTTALPQVAQARVTRDWPHTVHVTVTERQPLLGVPTNGGFYLVDKTGVAFETRPVLPNGVVAVAADVTDRPLLVELGSVVLALPDGVRTQVTSIAAATPDSIQLKTSSGVVIVWGDASQSALKAQVAVALLDSGAKTSIDVSAPHKPAVR